MSEPFLAEIRLFGFNFAPRGYAQCNGQFLPISQNQALFSLLGTTYGGDGRTSFALPELRGRTGVHEGTGTSGHTVTLGHLGGAQDVTLTTAQIASHDHGPMRGTQSNANEDVPNGNTLARSGFGRTYHNNVTTNIVDMQPTANAGNNLAHTNMQPFQVVNFCIAIQGTFPSRN